MDHFPVSCGSEFSSDYLRQLVLFNQWSPAHRWSTKHWKIISRAVGIESEIQNNPEGMHSNALWLATSSVVLAACKTMLMVQVDVDFFSPSFTEKPEKHCYKDILFFL